jgi:hypothetical protein
VRKLRAVVDTNVIVSGIISPKGAPRKILDLARREIFKVVSSIAINHEILNVLHRDSILAQREMDFKSFECPETRSVQPYCSSLEPSTAAFGRLSHLSDLWL